MHARSIVVAILLSFFVSTLAPSQELPAGKLRWYKGNLHAHSLWSDGDDFPEMIADWYKSNGYDFLSLSDHNKLSEGEMWMPLRDVQKRGGEIAMEKYRARLGDAVKTRRTEAAGEEVQLQPLTVLKQLIESPGKFLMIQSEEISDKYEGHPVHMNVTNIAEVIKPIGGSSVHEVIANNLRQVQDQAERTGQPMIVHVNHPNFIWGVSAEELAAVIEEHYFEVYNGHPLVHQLGDADHPSIEKLWDICNTIRLAQLNAEPLMGLATDDSHNYHVPGMSRATSGRGWVMVHATDLSPEAIVNALRAGDFYASSGVTIRGTKFDPGTRTLYIDIEPDGDEVFTTQFIGTPKNFTDGGKTPLNSDQVGKVLSTATGTSVDYKLKDGDLYVRAIITSDKPANNPSIEGQKKQAWTQPVGWVREAPGEVRESPNPLTP